MINSLNVGKKYDGRIKLTDKDREEIKILFQNPETAPSIRAVAKQYGVDHRTIQFILYPERKIIANEQLKLRHKEKRYYNTESNTLKQKKHRDKKRKLYQEGKISLNPI